MTWKTSNLEKMVQLFQLDRQIVGFGVHAKAICMMLLPCVKGWNRVYQTGAANDNSSRKV